MFSLRRRRVPITSAIHHSAEVIYRYRHVLFDRTLADAELCRDLSMAEAIKLVHANYTLCLRRQSCDRLEEPAQFVAFNEVLLCTRFHIRGLDGRGYGAVALLSPLDFTPLPSLRLAKPVEDEIVRYSKKISLGIGDRARRALRHPDPKLAHQIIRVGLASGPRGEEAPERGALLLQRSKQALL